MDALGEGAVRLLDALQDCVADARRLGQELVAGGRGDRVRHVLHVSGRPFVVDRGGLARQYRGSLAIGVLVDGADSREYDLGVDLLWDGQAWEVETQAWVANDSGGQDLVRALPTRTAHDLPSCLRELKGAIADLEALGDVVLGAQGRAVEQPDAADGRRTALPRAGTDGARS